MEPLIRLITFATDNFTTSAARLEATALREGVDSVDIYSPHDFDQSLGRIIEPLIEGSRGHGWWLWKPWICQNAITELPDADYLVYCDAGTEFTGNIIPLINSMDEDIFLCSNGWQHSHWCKREVSEMINLEYFKDNHGLGERSYYNFKQVQASFIIFKVNENTRKFIQEWYAWSLMPGFIDNTPRGPQFPEFQEHRHDQAILTCLQIKHGYKLHWFPTTMNQHQRTHEAYDTILNHHRKRNNEW